MSTKAFIESREEMEQILHDETLGFLGFSLNAEPYVVPLNFVYIEGRILFHCARVGRKLDILRANPTVCFTVGRQSGAVVRHPQGGSCRAEHDSVICRGTARILEDVEERRAALDVFNRRLQPDAEGISLDDAAKCLAVEIRVEEMTGRRWGNGKPACWIYRFQQPSAGE
jgi:nitroimidazol reductase NimA-like FMN-containing flavoprotein (pyridoxamine 5'-phosphate oxidase superfamily)